MAESPTEKKVKDLIMNEDNEGPEDLEDMKQTSPEREWKIKKAQEKLGLSRDLAEKMVDESSGGT
jgi:hypothetical protein